VFKVKNSKREERLTGFQKIKTHLGVTVAELLVTTKHISCCEKEKKKNYVNQHFLN